jgi:NADH:ubiquinone oxidoreductase subunit F (NADH-binding)
VPAAVRGSALIDELRAAGLQGRGGAAFPSWRKFAAIGLAQDPRSRAGAPVVVANGSEGEPKSIKDATLLRASPHLVIDGLLLAGQAIGANELYLVTTAAQLPFVLRAIAERSDAGAILVREVPEAFLSGEASAVIRSLDGGPSLPRDKAMRVSASGLGGRPTLLQNVETLAQVALIARFGAEWFRRLGTESEPGTRLVTVSGDDLAPTVREVVGGMTLGGLVEAAGGTADGLQAAREAHERGACPLRRVARRGHPRSARLPPVRLARFGGGRELPRVPVGAPVRTVRQWVAQDGRGARPSRPRKS